jgi:hypothetical protein
MGTRRRSTAERSASVMIHTPRSGSGALAKGGGGVRSLEAGRLPQPWTGCYAGTVMRSHRIRVVLLALLATIALDMVDADCVKGAWASEALCASPSGDCACCILSEGAAEDAHPPVSQLPTRSLPAPPGQTRSGVRPIPYRPPLAFS